MYLVISVIVDSLPGNTKNRESTRLWTARVRLVHPWAGIQSSEKEEGPQRCGKKSISLESFGMKSAQFNHFCSLGTSWQQDFRKLLYLSQKIMWWFYYSSRLADSFPIDQYDLPGEKTAGGATQLGWIYSQGFDCHPKGGGVWFFVVYTNKQTNKQTKNTDKLVGIVRLVFFFITFCITETSKRPYIVVSAVERI